MTEPAGPHLERLRLLGVLLGLAVGAGLTWAVVVGTGVPDLDRSVHDWVVGHRTSVLTAVARAVTLLGDTRTIVVVTGCAALALAWQRRRGELLLLLVGVGGASCVVVSVKHLVGRQRPPAHDMIGPIERAYSFPSGHTLMATTTAVLLLWTLMTAHQCRRRSWAGALVVTVAALVGLSRVYLGVHWASDVIASRTMATTWLLLLAVVSTRVVDWRARSPAHGPVTCRPAGRAPGDRPVR